MSVKPLRILYNHRTRSRDGQSVHIDELIEALRAEGHKVTVVGPHRIDAMSQGIERDLLPKAIYELAELAFSVVEFVQLYIQGRKTRPDFIYQRANIHMLGAAWAARLLKTRLFVEVNAPLTREREKHPGLAWPKLARWSEYSLWRQATMILPVTEVLAQEVINAGVPRDRVSVVANGVDPGRFRRQERELAKIPAGLQDRLILGFVGYVREWHGLEHVIDLLANDARLSKGHLVVVGDGPARPALAARAHRLGVSERVFFTGVVARDDVAKIAAAFDIALQPEVTPYASPLKLFEYMAMGHAIVAPDSANIREVLSHGQDALLFAPQNSWAFAEAVARLAEDSELRQALGAGAAKNIEEKNRTWRANARRIAALASSVPHDVPMNEAMVPAADARPA
jgi:glycosyltransferase involved in cell wall biosynthesis